MSVRNGDGWSGIVRVSVVRLRQGRSTLDLAGTSSGSFERVFGEGRRRGYILSDDCTEASEGETKTEVMAAGDKNRGNGCGRQGVGCAR